jgi:HAD superfamily hydrolase (TIGR01509 family)
VSSTLLFDLDNTLVDRDAAMRRWAGQWPVSDSVRTEILAVDAGGQGCRVALTRLLDQTLPRAGGWTAAAIAGEVAARVVADEAVRAMLRRLAKHYALGLVTNGGGESQREKLRRAGLEELFSVVRISGEMGVAKPEAPIFDSALAALNCAAADAVFVGDSLSCDIQGARALGMRTVWIDAQQSAHPDADLVIADVLELESQLAQSGVAA